MALIISKLSTTIELDLELDFNRILKLKKNLSRDLVPN